ncbi:MAG: hypothetical protein ILM98_16180 [Kiritimatiellae bacterium]|nr:hypothetical protein [Kiritimatiellia bacterium]
MDWIRHSIFAAALLAAASAPASNLYVPTPGEVFRQDIDMETACEQMAHRAWNDGRNAVFMRERGDGEIEWKISYNDREITFAKTPENGDVLQFAKFLYGDPWRNALERRLRGGAELSQGEREMVRLVYASWIDSLKVLTSLGYQYLLFHANVCEKNFEKKAQTSNEAKKGSITDRTIYGALLQGFFDNEAAGGEISETMSAWGESFDEIRDARRDVLKSIIHGGDRKRMSAMSQRQLNEYFYIPPRMADFSSELAKPTNAAKSRIEHWLRLHEEIQETISVLSDIRDAFAEWQEKFNVETLSSSQASSLREEMTALRKALDAANEDAVKRARIVFYDFPFVRACLDFRKDIDKSLSWMFSRNTEYQNLLKAGRKFYAEIAGEAMLANIKSNYAAIDYEDILKLFEKSAGKEANRLMKEVRLPRIGVESLRNLAEGRDIWSANTLLEIARPSGEEE